MKNNFQSSGLQVNQKFGYRTLGRNNIQGAHFICSRLDGIKKSKDVPLGPGMPYALSNKNAKQSFNQMEM
jgi:hypothetical protein